MTHGEEPIARSITREEALQYHLGGKVRMAPARILRRLQDLCLAYTPGVAHAVREIHRNRETLYRYTSKANLVAVVTDGTAILGLGDLGAEASIPVMEGKAILFKAFADVDGWPVPLAGCRTGGRDTGPTDVDRVIETVVRLAPLYGGINLEDIAAPACFEIEERLDALLDIPVFHDDQWGTAVIVLAALYNYAMLSERDLSELRVVIHGAGAAGIRIAEMLKHVRVRHVVLCDSKGVVRTDRTDLTSKKKEHAVSTTASTLGEVIRNAHVFIGVSVANCVRPEEIQSMASYPAVFALANPDPEIRPEAVAAAFGNRPYAMATGRSDYPNQVNNVLGFPFLFRGALDTRARSITWAMKTAAAQALAALAREPVPPDVNALYAPEAPLMFGPRYLIPKPFDRRLFVEVSYAVAEAAIASGVAPWRDLTAYRSELEERNRTRG